MNTPANFWRQRGDGSVVNLYKDSFAGCPGAEPTTIRVSSMSKELIWPQAQLSPAGTSPSSEAQRLVDTFIAPSKTFTDFRRNASGGRHF